MTRPIVKIERADDDQRFRDKCNQNFFLLSASDRSLGAGSDAWPVGSIYQSTVSTSPEILFGGVWAALENMFLVGAGDGAGDFQAGSTGGSRNAIVVAHTHVQQRSNTDNGTGAPIQESGGADDGTNKDSAYVVDITRSTSQRALLRTQSTGSSGVDANLPPYKVVYMWERTA